MVKVDAVVFGGKLDPVSVTVLPVETDAGETATEPLGTDMLTVLLLSDVAVSGDPSSLTVDALSVTVT
jgi:hypothetical protein